MRVSAIQINTQNDKEKNIYKVLKLIDQAVSEGAELVSLPEYMNFLGSNEEKFKNAEPIPGPTSEALMDKAREHGIFIHCGSILEKTDEDRCYNTSLFINDQGKITNIYRKVHLFDIEIEDRVYFKESDTIKPGEELVTVDTPFGQAGLSICYDLRFPELYRSLAMKGAKILFIPAAFTLYTGLHHWEVLLRARAIENQCYVIAAGQYGSYPPENKTNFGSSMIIDPWGTVIARAPEEEGVITANIEHHRIEETRENVPCFSHRRPALYGTI